MGGLTRKVTVKYYGGTYYYTVITKNSKKILTKVNKLETNYTLKKDDKIYFLPTTRFKREIFNKLAKSLNLKTVKKIQNADCIIIDYQRLKNGFNQKIRLNSKEEFARYNEKSTTHQCVNKYAEKYIDRMDHITNVIFCKDLLKQISPAKTGDISDFLTLYRKLTSDDAKMIELAKTELSHYDIDKHKPEMHFLTMLCNIGTNPSFQMLMKSFSYHKNITCFDFLDIKRWCDYIHDEYRDHDTTIMTELIRAYLNQELDCEYYELATKTKPVQQEIDWNV